MAKQRKKPQGSLHHHGCTSCRATYRCACETTDVASVCLSCKSGRWPIWDLAKLPRECCLAGQPIRAMSKDEVKVYKLAPSSQVWFRCLTCSRCFSVQPSQVLGPKAAA